MTNYTNESPVDMETITTENGIMVISFNPNDTNDKPSVSYYSSQQEFKDSWENAGGICPVTRKTYCVSVPLSTLSPEKLSSLDALGEPDTLQEGGLEHFQENSYAKVFFKEFSEKSIKSNREIQKILEGFKEKIATIGEHHPEAKEVAIKLHKDLTELTENTFNQLDDEKLAAFPEKARQLITDATPILQQDLDWGSYLSNLAKEFANAATKFFTAGYHQGFFTVKNSNAADSARELNTELEQQNSLKFD